MVGRRARSVAVVALAIGLAGANPLEAAPADPPSVEAGSSDWLQISAGTDHTCGIRRPGRLYCWGSDADGKLGDGSPIGAQDNPVEVSGGFTDWTQVSAGDDHTCGRRATGQLYCWGDDGQGQLGNGAQFGVQLVPVPVAGRSNWVQVSAGQFHTCGRRRTGRLFCWGSDGQGQLGNGPGAATQDRPVQVAGGVTNWTQVSAGQFHTCGRRSTGRLFCWGNDDDGQLGNGMPAADQQAPVQVAGRFTTWKQVNAGRAHTCGVRSGRVFCWGDDDDGQLGNSAPAANRFAPAAIASAFTDWRQVSAGANHTCARRSNRRLYCWGRDTSGQLGNDVTLGTHAAPVEVASGATDWVAVDAGGSHTCARIVGGRALCWGADSQGQVGDDGTNTFTPVPTLVWT